MRRLAAPLAALAFVGTCAARAPAEALTLRARQAPVSFVSSGLVDPGGVARVGARVELWDFVAAADYAAALERAQAVALVPSPQPVTVTVVGGSAPNPSAAGVVAFAEAQLGKPYVYAAAGPDAYDCSGLVMAAYASVGVGLPHQSEGQYGALRHVSLDQVQPGDVVWAPGHVGIYVGGGRVVHAPHPGTSVSYIDLSIFQGAARP